MGCGGECFGSSLRSFAKGRSSFCPPPGPLLRASQSQKPRAASPTPPNKRRKVAPASTEAAPPPEAALPAKRRGRKRGRGSKRPRGGREKQEQKAGVSEGRTRRLRERAFREGEAVRSDEFSMQQHGSASSSGWQGRAPPKKTQEQLRRLHESGEILQLLQAFFPIPYAMPPR